MSANVSGLLIVFSEDISEESARKLSDLLLWLDGVTDVKPVEGNVDQMLAQMRVDSEWRNRIIGLLKDAKS